MIAGIIDADLLDNGTRHPNLALMKISAFLKDNGHEVTLLNSYDSVGDFEKVYISKVFTKTNVPIELQKSNIVYGGTGFFLDSAPNLPDSIEHHFPDYHLYDGYIDSRLRMGDKQNRFKDYLYYSIGFGTRGCFRKCSFCVNKKYDQVIRHSPIKEFFDNTRPYIYLWDDNFLGFPGWGSILDELDAINRPFQFRQGLDIRLLNKDKALRLSRAKYHGDFIFAFDSVDDEPYVRKGLSIWRSLTLRTTKLYVLCAYKSLEIDDIYSIFYRVKILMQYGCLPYIMRFENWKASRFAGIYISIARWCNQPALFKKMSFRQFCEANGQASSTMRYLRWFTDAYPDFPKEYLDMRFEVQNQYKRD